MTTQKLTPELIKIRDDAALKSSTIECLTSDCKEMDEYGYHFFIEGFDFCAEIFMKREERHHMYETHNHLMRIIQMQKESIEREISYRNIIYCTSDGKDNLKTCLDRTEKMLKGDEK